MNLILPVAGGSTRFSSGKPKFMLTHPSGNTMLFESIQGLDLSRFKNIYIVFREDTYKAFKLQNFVSEQFGGKKFKEIIISNTTSQAHTVAQALKHIGDESPFFVKDCDNFFKTDIPAESNNFICYGSLKEYDSINPGNKSYVSISDKGAVENIVEKRIIGDSFCVGGYAFESPAQFIDGFNALSARKTKGEIYISDIVFRLLLKNEFLAIKVDDYIDWGTQKDWDLFREKHATYFVDIDGVLVKNSAKFTHPRWGESDPILENIKTINELYLSGKSRIILTTSRSKSDATLKQLKKHGVLYHDIIFNLPHAKRILINDFSTTNKYRTAEAINIERDSNNLSSYLWKR